MKHLLSTKGSKMKQILPAALLAALALGAVSALAAESMGDMKGIDMGRQKTSPGAQNTHKTTGVVKEIDAKAGIVTFVHEPVNLELARHDYGFCREGQGPSRQVGCGQAGRVRVREGRQGLHGDQRQVII